MDRDEPGRQQLLLLSVVVPASVKQLINTNLNGTEGMGDYSHAKERCIVVFHCSATIAVVHRPAYLA